MSTDVYQIVTDRIVGLLERGAVPWRIPYRGGAAGFPRNLKSGKPYRGVNVFLLAVEAWSRGYESAYWLTFKQAGERGGHVRRGEKSTPVGFLEADRGRGSQERRTEERSHPQVLPRFQRRPVRGGRSAGRGGI